MKKIMLLLLAGAMLFACGKKEVKQVSPESRTAMEAFALAETVKTAFINKDDEILKKSSTEEGYKQITANFRGYDRVELTFTPRWVEIENDSLNVNISWKSIWVSAGKRAEDRGMAVFIMQGTPLRIAGILRANPFIQPEQ